tara:strand:+ start:310 stop:492 length:183 start_codon:yes stop_codon:yes gene_type:complete
MPRATKLQILDTRHKKTGLRFKSLHDLFIEHLEKEAAKKKRARVIEGIKKYKAEQAKKQK